MLKLPEAHSFHHEYNSMACTVEIVDDVHAAIDHIHRHGRHSLSPLLSLFHIVQYIYIEMSHFSSLLASAHTDSIIAEDLEVAELFLRQVDR